MSDFWGNETFLQLFVPLLGALFVTFFTWRLNRTLSQGRPMTSFAKKVLSHGFLFMLGMLLFMAWNRDLAIFLRFSGREVWRPLAIGWAIVLIYDAAKRIQEERQIAGAVEALNDSEAVGNLRRAGREWQAGILTILRFVFFFAIVGAICRPSVAAFAVVVVLIGGLLAASKLWKASDRASAHQEPEGR